MNRKLLAKVLAASLVLTATPALPGAEADAASQKTGGGYLSLVKSNRGAAENTVSELDCPGWWGAHTRGVEVTEKGVGFTFTSTTYATAKDEWCTPLIVAYSGDEPKVNGTGYVEHVVMRSDDYAWAGSINSNMADWTDKGYELIKSGYDFITNKEVWLEKNKAGIDCKVNAIKTNGRIKIEYSRGDIKSSLSFPYTGDKEVYISLTGQDCKLTNIIELSEDLTPDNPGTEDPKPDNPGTEDPKPDNPGTDTPGDTENSITFGEWWTKHLDGVKITEEGITANFKSKSNAEERFKVPVYVVFSSDDKKVNGTNYAEYGVMRSDYAGWAGTAGKIKYWGEGSEKYYVDKETGETGTAGEITAWSEAKQKDYVDYTVSAYKSGRYVFMKINAGGLVTYAKVTVSSSADTYLSLSGEQCSVKDITWNNTGTFESNEPEDLPTDDTVVDCPGWQTNFSKGYKVDGSGVSLTFDSKTYDVEGVANWFTPQVFVYTSDDGEVKGEGYGYLANFRSDAFVEMPEGANYSTTFRGVGDWGLWLDANKSEAGVKCAVSAVREDNKVVVKFSNNGITGFLTIPEIPVDKEVYIALTGGSCKLTNITSVTFTGITIPSGIATYPVILPTPTPAPTLPPAGEDNGEGLELDCEGWWTAHTSGIEVTDSGVALTFKNTTYSSAANQWEIPVVVAYTGDEAKVNGAGYDEYVVIRGDAYAWTTKAADANTGAGLAAWNNLGYTFQSNASTFDTWLADNKAGTNCKVQAVKKDGKVIIETTVGSVTSYTTFPVDAGKKVYISLSGEKCKLTNIKTAQYTAINVPGGTPSATATPAPSAAPSATPAPSTVPSATPAPGATATPGTDKPGTPDPGTTSDPGTPTPGTPETPEEPSKEDNKKKTMKVSDITAKTGKKKVTGTLSVKGTKVQVKVGNKKYKNAKVNGKKFTFTASSKLKKGTKITIKVTKSGYKTVTKTVKVK